MLLGDFVKEKIMCNTFYLESTVIERLRLDYNLQKWINLKYWFLLKVLVFENIYMLSETFLRNLHSCYAVYYAKFMFQGLYEKICVGNAITYYETISFLISDKYPPPSPEKVKKIKGI